MFRTKVIESSNDNDHLSTYMKELSESQRCNNTDATVSEFYRYLEKYLTKKSFVVAF